MQRPLASNISIKPSRKTAILFAAACEGAALSAVPMPKNKRDALDRPRSWYRLQLVDDVLDMKATRKPRGKHRR